MGVKLRWTAPLALWTALTGVAPDAEPIGESAAPPICGDGQAPTPAAQRPELLEGYGSGGFPIRTRVPRAQAYFDNGLQLATAFAHGPAASAMKEAVRRDPACAMCLWGEALVSGPTINYPIDASEAVALGQLTAKARALAVGGPEKEVALIEALALRFPVEAQGYRSGGAQQNNLAYAEAMGRLAERWPQDDAIAVLTADALMVSSPGEGNQKRLGRAIGLLEGVLARSPNDTAAIHLHIHATEWADQPGKAEAAADRLPRLAPEASHLIHMPAHTYYRLGRYQDAVTANLAAARLGAEDARLLGRSGPDAAWLAPYHLHNVHFGIGAALIVGNGAAALELSNPVIAYVRSPQARSFGDYGLLSLAAAYYAQGVFADPAAVLALPPPSARFGAEGFWHYARGEAAARQGDWRQVLDEAKAIRPPRGNGRTAKVLVIAREVLLGRADMLRGRPAKALRHFDAAAGLQERSGFAQGDPPPFWYPIHRDAARALLVLGRPQEAEFRAKVALTLFPREPEAERIVREAETARKS